MKTYYILCKVLCSFISTSVHGADPLFISGPFAVPNFQK